MPLFMCILHRHAVLAVLQGTSDYPKHQHGPPPLRSMRRPMGLFNLKGVQKLRVEAANRLYQWTVDMIIQLDARNVDWSIENPASSLLWITDPFLMLRFHVSRIFAVSFHTCMYMADRKEDHSYLGELSRNNRLAPHLRWHTSTFAVGLDSIGNRFRNSRRVCIQ